MRPSDYRPATHHLDRRAHQLIAVCEGPDDEMLKPDAVSEWLGVSGMWLSLGRSKGYGPPFKRLSNQVVLYRRGDIRAWLESRTYRSTSEYPERAGGRAA